MENKKVSRICKTTINLGNNKQPYKKIFISPFLTATLQTEDCQEFGKEVRIMEDGNGYQIKYFTEQGKEVEGYISKEDMKIICDINKDKKVEK